MGSRVCTRCNHPPRYCQCEMRYYVILLAVSLVFPIAELIIGKMLARSSLVLLDGLHALAISWTVYLDPLLTTAIAIWFIAKSLPYLLPR